MVVDSEVRQTLTLSEVSLEEVGFSNLAMPIAVEEGVDVTVKHVFGMQAFSLVGSVAPEVAGSSLVRGLESDRIVGQILLTLVLSNGNCILKSLLGGFINSLPISELVGSVNNIHNGVLGVGGQIAAEHLGGVAIGNTVNPDGVNKLIGILCLNALELQRGGSLVRDVNIETTVAVALELGIPTEDVVGILVGDNLVEAFLVLGEREAEASLGARGLRAP